MTYDGYLDERRPPTLRSALEDFAEVLCRPVAKRLTRAVRWCEKLRRLEIDWTNFGCTRGGYFDWLGTPLVYKPDRHDEPVVPYLVAAGGVIPRGLDDGRWKPWAKWWVGFDWSLESYLPKIQAQRGGIRHLPSGALAWPAPMVEPIPFLLPVDSSEPDYKAPRLGPLDDIGT